MATHQNRQDQDKVIIRLPDGMRDCIRAAAQGNRRSANAEIVARLEASFEADSASLNGEIAALIQKHVEAEVQRRLREIAAQIGGA